MAFTSTPVSEDIPRLIPQHDDSSVERAVDTIRSGGILLYPTDTIYGLGCDPFNTQALDRLYALKRRHKSKKPVLIASSVEMVERFAHMDARAHALAEAFWWNGIADTAPHAGAVSLVLPRREGTLTTFFIHEPSIVFRVPAHPWCRALIDAFDQPVVSTSANLSNHDTEDTPKAILAQFGDTAKEIGLVIDGGCAQNILPSTLVSLKEPDSWQILRQGTVSKEDIERVINGSV